MKIIFKNCNLENSVFKECRISDLKFIESTLEHAIFSNVLIENKDIKEYFDYEIAFNQLMVDVNKIIGNSIKDVL